MEEIAKHEKSAIQKKYNMKQKQTESVTRTEWNKKKSAKWKECNMRKAHHGKSGKNKREQHEIQHENSENMQQSIQ